jgi:uracil-DNA glycosylase family 4
LSALRWDEHPLVTASAPGYGSLSSPVALIGQSIKRAGRGKNGIFISNVMHCHPPKNRASHEHEIVNCSQYLHRELEIVRPRLVSTLGHDAERVLTFFYPRARVCKPPFKIPRGRLPKSVPNVFHAKHPSWIQRQHNDELEDELRVVCCSWHPVELRSGERASGDIVHEVPRRRCGSRPWLPVPSGMVVTAGAGELGRLPRAATCTGARLPPDHAGGLAGSRHRSRAAACAAGRYAWGTGSSAFLIGRRARVLRDNDARRVDESLHAVAEKLRNGNTVEAYTSMLRGGSHDLKHLGPSFFTKFLCTTEHCAWLGRRHG